MASVHYFGATPDCKISCTYCGTGFVEVQCPYCHRGESIESDLEDKSFCLQKTSDGNLYILILLLSPNTNFCWRC